MRSVVCGTRGLSDLTDDQWRRLRPLLPTQKPKTGRPEKDHRTVINGILWILRTGSPWRDLPERFGPWATVASRFYRWRRQGLWDRLLAEVQREADTIGQVDWEVHYVDGTSVRAHQHAAGAKRVGRSGAGPFPGRIQRQSPSESRGAGQAGSIRADPGSAARGQRVRGVDDSRGGETLRAWPSPHQTPAGLRRQRVQRSQDSGLFQATGNSLHHPPGNPTNVVPVLSTGPCTGHAIWWSGQSIGSSNSAESPPGMRRGPRTIWQCCKSARC